MRFFWLALNCNIPSFLHLIYLIKTVLHNGISYENSKKACEQFIMEIPSFFVQAKIKFLLPIVYMAC